MAIIRYKKSNAPTGGQRWVQRDDGQVVDLLSIGESGYTVDSAQFPLLVAALDSNPLVQRSGGGGAVSAPNAPASTGIWAPKGPWNSGAEIFQNDVWTFLGGSYLALNHIAPGGQSPAVDTVNWMQLVGGGGELAGPAEITTNFAFAMTASTLQDVTGMTLAIPAGIPAYEVLAEAQMIQFIFAGTAVATTQATLRLLLVDEANVALAQSIVRVNAGAASAVQWGQSRVSRKMPASAAAKTVKLSGWLDSVTNITSVTLWAGAGTSTPPSTGTLGPVSMVARAR